MSLHSYSSAALLLLLRERIAEFIVMAPAEVPGTANLVLLGLTSLNLMRLNTQLRRLGIPVDFDDMIATPTLDAWTRQVEAAARVQLADT